MKSKAAVLVELKKKLVIEQIEIPKLDYGQVLVKVLVSGICGSQLGEIAGNKGPDKYLPHLLGHEGTGLVVETGPGVSTVKQDDKVVLHWRPGSGLQAAPPKYTSQALGTVNAGWVTTFNDYAVVSENRVTAIDPDIPPDIASLLGCAVTTGLGAVNNNGRVRIGDSAAVWGAGGIGLSIIQGLSMAGAHPIIAIDLLDAKLNLAAELGATHTINAKKEDAALAVKKITGPGLLDVAFENTGNVELISQAYEMTNARGRTILMGVPAAGQKASLYTLPLHFTKVITGSHGGEALPEYDIPRYLKLWRIGKLKLKPLITDTFELDAINTALKKMQQGKITGRCLITLASA